MPSALHSHFAKSDWSGISSLISRHMSGLNLLSVDAYQNINYAYLTWRVVGSLVCWYKLNARLPLLKVMEQKVTPMGLPFDWHLPGMKVQYLGSESCPMAPQLPFTLPSHMWGPHGCTVASWKSWATRAAKERDCARRVCSLCICTHLNSHIN